MDFLLGSLAAGTGGDGMNLGTIENMEVRNYNHFDNSNSKLKDDRIIRLVFTIILYMTRL